MEILNKKTSCKSCIYKGILFKSLSQEEFDLVDEGRQEISYKKGELITAENEKITKFLYLKSGLVKIYKTTEDGYTHIISIGKPMDFVSLLSIFSNDVYKYSISALENSVVCAVDLQIIRDRIASNGKFALDVMNRMSCMSDDIIETRFNLSSKHLRGRIAYILNYFSVSVYHDLSFTLPVSRREIAELINMTTENVIRILSEFRKDGIISIEGKKITINNPERLETICKLG